MANDNNKHTIYLPLEDVDSEHCAMIVDKGLEGVQGVASHRVELNNKRAVITADNPEVVAEAVRAIKGLGMESLQSDVLFRCSICLVPHVPLVLNPS